MAKNKQSKQNLYYDWLTGKTLTKRQFEQEMQNEDALNETGYWGERAAGVLPLALDTKKFLFALRSGFVQEPGTWGLFGGAIDKNETPVKAALREFQEEAQYHGKILKTYPLATFKDKAFRYYTFIVVLPTEFKPHLNHETDKFIWVEYDKWPRPLHPKLRMTLNNFKVDSILKEFSEND